MIANGIFQRGKIENSNITSTWSFSLFLESLDYVFQNQISRQTINTFWIGRYFTSTCWTFYIGFQVRLVVRASVFLHPFCPCLRCTIRFQDFPRAWCTEIMRAWKNNRSLKKIQANRTRQLNLHCHRKKCRVYRDAVDIVLYLLVTLVAGGYKFGQKRGIRARTTALVSTHAQATIPNFLLFSSVLDFVLVCKVFGVVPFLSWCISAVSKEKFAMQGFYLPEAFTYI